MTAAASVGSRPIDSSAPSQAITDAAGAGVAGTLSGSRVTVGQGTDTAVTTATSIREARRTPRVVGPHWQEGR